MLPSQLGPRDLRHPQQAHKLDRLLLCNPFFHYEQSLLELVGTIREETRQIGGERIVLMLVTTVLRVAHSGAASGRLSGGVYK